jgi:hypothetical protein
MQEDEAARIFRQSAHEGGKVVILTHRLPLLPGKTPGTHCYNLSQLQGPSAAGRIKSMKHIKDLNGNRTCDLLAYNAVPQPTAVLCALSISCYTCYSLPCWSCHKPQDIQHCYFQVSCTKFHPNLTLKGKVWTEILLHPLVKYGCHFAALHKTYNYLTALNGHNLAEFYARNMGSTGRNSFMPISKV